MLEPSGARVQFCEQSLEEPGGVQALADALDRSARRILGQLRLDPQELERWSTLPPGERKRWQIGAALWTEPDLLLLDGLAFGGLNVVDLPLLASRLARPCIAGMRRAAEALERLTDTGVVPEALRFAHLIGSAVQGGQSTHRA